MNRRLLGVRVQTWVAAGALAALVGFISAATGFRDHALAQSPAVAPAAGAQGATSYAKSLSVAFREAAQKTLPAVVMIKNLPVVHEQPQERDASPESPFDESPFGDTVPPEFRHFFKDLPPMPHGIPHGEVGGIGSGVIIDPLGHHSDQQPRRRGRRQDHRPAARRPRVRGHRCQDRSEDRSGHRPHQGCRDAAGGKARQQRRRPGGRLGAGPRRSVRTGRHGHGGHHQRQGTRAGQHSPRKLHPDRRRHQPRQQRRPAGKPRRRGDRHQHRHLLAQRRQPGRRLCRFEQSGQVGQPAVDRPGRREAGVSWRRHPAGLATIWPNNSACRRRKALSSAKCSTDTPAADGGSEARRRDRRVCRQSRSTARKNYRRLWNRRPVDAKHPLTVVRDGKRLTLTVTTREQPADYGLARNRSRLPGKEGSYQRPEVGHRGGRTSRPTWPRSSASSPAKAW